MPQARKLSEHQEKTNIFTNTKRKDVTQGNVLLSNLVKDETMPMMSNSKIVKGMRFATYMPEATNLAYSIILSGTESNPNLVSAMKRRRAAPFSNPNGIMAMPNRDQLIANKQELRNKKKNALDLIKRQQNQFRVSSRPRMTGDYWKAATARVNTQEKPTEAELFKIVKKKDRYSVGATRQTFLDKFYKQNGIVDDEHMSGFDNQNPISPFSSRGVVSKSMQSFI